MTSVNLEEIDVPVHKLLKLQIRRGGLASILCALIVESGMGLIKIHLLLCD